MSEFDFAEKWYLFLIAAVVCYFIGCVNFAVMISKFKRKDIRKVGSGNPGTLNVTRTFGLKTGILNFFCDLLKGGIPSLVGFLLFKDFVFAGTDIPVSDFARYFFGLFVVIGHIFPVNLRFCGGKGIASTMGLFVFSLSCEKWWYFFIVGALLLCILAYIALTEWGAMGSLIGVALLTVFQAVIFAVKYAAEPMNGWVISLFAMLLLLNVLTWGAHRKNIYRLLAGEEHKTSVLKRKNKP